MRNYRSLIVWEKSHDLVLQVYKASKNFPSDERFGLISQIQRASSSIPTNIAEGSGRSSTKDFAWFLNVSAGSTSEVSYLLLLARDLGYLNTDRYDDLANKAVEIQKMLRSFIEKLNANG